MKVIYENKVKASGIAVEEFKDAGMFIIFGENAPEEIRDFHVYYYSIWASLGMDKVCNL